MLSKMKMISYRCQFLFIATTVFFLANGLSAQNKLPTRSFGVQLSPFLIGSPNLGKSIILPDSLLLGIEDLANANPSLQVGFFFERRFSERWLFRVDANLMHRSIWYMIIDNPWGGFFQAKRTPAASILVTVNLPIQIQYRLHRRLHVSGGLATQFHFGPRESINNNSSRPELMLASRVEQGYRSITLHTQYGLFWHTPTWSLGFSSQQSLTSITTGFEWRGLNYELPELNTRIYYINIGYRILPSRKKMTE